MFQRTVIVKDPTLTNPFKSEKIRYVISDEDAIFYGIKKNTVERSKRNYDTTPSKPNRYYPVKKKIDGVLVTEWIKQ